MSEGHLCQKDIITNPKKFSCNFFSIWGLCGLLIVLLLPQWNKDTKYVLTFEIGYQEGGEKIERTETLSFGF